MKKGKWWPGNTKSKLQSPLQSKDRLGRPNQEKAAKLEQKPDKAGLLITAELNNALEEWKAKVARISKECRAKKRKFRCA
jgi:hypothetical protein